MKIAPREMDCNIERKNAVNVFSPSGWRKLYSPSKSAIFEGKWNLF